MNQTQRLVKPANRVLLLPVVLVTSLFLPWFVVSGLVTLTVAGTDLVIEPVLISSALIVGGSWLYQGGKYRVRGWVTSGIAVEGAILWTLLEVRKGIEAQAGTAGGRLFGEMISIDAGVGLFLAAAVGLLIFLVGVREYVASTEAVTLPAAVSGMVNADDRA